MLLRTPLAIVAIALAALVFPTPVDAFCGFYVAGSDGPLYNDATMVVLVREGTHTVLSMRNDYRGPTEDFAMVVPVPEVLEEADVRTLESGVFDRVDQLASPRLVEYWEQDPCAPQPAMEALGSLQGFGGLGLRGTGRGGGGMGVTIEAEFAVGEYEIVILSAEDSTGLDQWLRANDYRIPDGAEAALRPYVESGTKFFVARVDADKVRFEDGRAVLSPLRIHYESETFSLPVRLGMLNSSGTQDLIVHILADDQRYEVANYNNVTIPTNIDVRQEARDRFGEVYAAIFDRTLESNPGAVVTEYSWQASSCDPCPGGMSGLSPRDLATLGDGVDQGDSDSTSWVSVVRPGRVERLQGSLSTEIVRRMLRRHVNQVRFCHEQNVSGPVSTANAQLDVELQISADGRVAEAEVGAPDSHEALAACARRAFRRIRFPTTEGEGAEATRVRFTYRLRGDSAPRGSLGFYRRPKVLTRLHYRYEEGGLASDLVFRAADPIEGGREVPNEDGELSLTANTIAGTNNFQARYAIRHEWTGPIECEDPVRGRWGGPPPREVEGSPESGREGRLDPEEMQRQAEQMLLGALGTNPAPTVAQNVALAPRGQINLASVLAQPVPALNLEDSPAALQQSAESGDEEDTPSSSAVPRARSVDARGCGCSIPSSSGHAPWGLLLFSVLAIYLRRRE